MNTKQLLKTLVETESPSHDKSAVDRVGALVAEESRKLGAHEMIPNHDTGDHILMRFFPDLQPGTLDLMVRRTGSNKVIPIRDPEDINDSFCVSLQLFAQGMGWTGEHVRKERVG